MYRCSLPETGGHPGNEYLPEEVRGFAFAPRDVRLRQYEGKEDLHGIGYRGMEERAVLSSKETKKAVHGMRGEVSNQRNGHPVYTIICFPPFPASLFSVFFSPGVVEVYTIF